MTHDTIHALGQDANDESPVASIKNRIAISQSIADELELVEGQQVTVTNLEAISKRRGRGRYLGAYQIQEVVDDTTRAVYLGERGRSAISDSERFPAEVRNQVPNNTLTVEDARSLGEFTETVHFESPKSDILVMAYHGGAIEANTDESAWWFYKKCKEWDVDVDVYTARGFGKKNFNRWHIGSSSMHLRSFPKLQRVAQRQYDLAVAFHLHDVKGHGSPKVLVGGRVEKELREQTADRLADYLPSKYDHITDRSNHSMMGGGRQNIVNWLTRDGESGLQIESTPRNQQIRRKGVGRYVAHAVLEHRGLKNRSDSQEQNPKPVLGATELITLIGEETREVEARVDSGAERSCIDSELAEMIGVGSELNTKKIRTSNGDLNERPIVEHTVDIRGREHHVKPSVMERSGMSTDYQLGRDILENYRVDVGQ